MLNFQANPKHFIPADAADAVDCVEGAERIVACEGTGNLTWREREVRMGNSVDTECDIYVFVQPAARQHSVRCVVNVRYTGDGSFQLYMQGNEICRYEI